MPFEPDTASVEQALEDVTLYNELARGGQKVVFLGESSKFGKIAVKLIKPDSGAAELRATREIEVAKSLADSHFPRLFESKKVTVCGVEVICIYEEFLEGTSLRSVLQEQVCLPGKETVMIGREISAALEILESSQVVHRDIKPENIYLAERGRVVLLDLGIARQLGVASLTDDNAIFGPLTPGYGAPEQIRNEKRAISPRTDIFALNVVMYECFSGANPFSGHGATPRDALMNTLNLSPESLETFGSSRELARVIARGMEKSPHRRFPSPTAFLRQLNLCPEANE